MKEKMDFSKDSLELSTDHVLTQGTKDLELSLSAWEKWMIEKTRKEREHQKMLLARKMEAELRRREEFKKEKERRMRGDQCHREWVGKKGEQIKTKREENEKKMREEILSVTEKKKKNEERATVHYKTWYGQKDKAKLKHKQVEIQERDSKLREQRQRQQDAEVAYKEWLSNIRKERKRESDWWRQGQNDTFSISSDWIS